MQDMRRLLTTILAKAETPGLRTRWCSVCRLVARTAEWARYHANAPLRFSTAVQDELAQAKNKSAISSQGMVSGPRGKSWPNYPAELVPP